MRDRVTIPIPTVPGSKLHESGRTNSLIMQAGLVTSGDDAKLSQDPLSSLLYYDKINEYKERFGRSSMASICLNLLASACSRNVHVEGYNEKELSSIKLPSLKKLKTKLEELIEISTLNSINGDCFYNAVYEREGYLNTFVEPVFVQAGINKGQLMAFRFHPAELIYMKVDTDGNHTGWSRIEKIYKSVIPTVDVVTAEFEDYPIMIESVKKPFKPKVGKRYLINIKGRSAQSISHFGSHPEAIIQETSLDYEQRNTMLQLVARGFQGSAGMYVQSDTEDGVYKGHNFDPITGEYEYPSLMQSLEGMHNDDNYGRSFSLTIIPMINGVVVNREDWSSKVDIPGTLEQSKYNDATIRAYFEVPPSAIFFQESSGLSDNGPRAEIDLKNFYSTTVPRKADNVFNTLNYIVSQSDPFIDSGLSIYPDIYNPFGRKDTIEDIKANIITTDEERENRGLEPLDKEEKPTEEIKDGSDQGTARVK